MVPLRIGRLLVRPGEKARECKNILVLIKIQSIVANKAISVGNNMIKTKHGIDGLEVGCFSLWEQIL